LGRWCLSLANAPERDQVGGSEIGRGDDVLWPVVSRIMMVDKKLKVRPWFERRRLEKASAASAGGWRGIEDGSLPEAG